MSSRRLYALSFTVTLLIIGSTRLAAQATDEKSIVATSANAKFGPIPNAPECFTVAVQRGDPTKGPSVILAKFAPGCVAPFHPALAQRNSDGCQRFSSGLNARRRRIHGASRRFHLHASASRPSRYVSWRRSMSRLPKLRCSL